MEFYSHLDPQKILLKDHLKEVGESSKEIVRSKKLEGFDKDVISEVSYLIGISHDFGKYTRFFQEKLNLNRNKNDPCANHALLSALFVFEIVSDYIKSEGLSDSVYKFLPLFAYFIVKRHHLDLDNIEDDIDVENLCDSGFKYVSEQMEDIWNNKSQIIAEYEPLLQDYGIAVEKIFKSMEKYKRRVIHSPEIENLTKEISEEFCDFKKSSKKVKDIRGYLLVQLLYSVLIDSDKKHAGHIREIERRKIPETLVEDYLKSEKFKEENKSSINSIRDEIHASVLKNILDPRNLEQKIFTLTAPTGTGKTLTSFSAALMLRKRLKEKFKLEEEPRIIYSLPFTSIIDQNFDVFDRVLSQIEDFEKYESEYLLKHHHLSEVFYKTKDMDKEEDVDESLALIESWESEIIVTTFIQLFYTLIGYRNRSLKKFHNIVNSIILLDEVQNIPIAYWKLVAEILNAMTNYFNCRVILMTATKPLIFEEGTYKELVDNYENYFNRPELDRVCLKIDHEKKQIVDLCESLDDFPKHSYLFVFNTIGSSIDFYNQIKDMVQKFGFEIYYLSTNIIPEERWQRIEKIKTAIDRGEKIVVVSTQLIEAGVDIDCDCVYRDMGPLDSIMQVAGRCNRNKRLEQSDMYLLNLVSEDNKPFTGIYDPVLLDVVRQILNDKSQIHESGFLKLINEFFEAAKAKSRVETTLINSIYELYFYDKNPNNEKRKPISDFALIKEDYYKIDVFIEVDDKAKEVWKSYGEIRAIKDPREQKKEFLKIKKDFYSYVISVDKKKAGRILNPDLDIGYVSKEDREKYYDLKTGFTGDSGAWTI